MVNRPLSPRERLFDTNRDRFRLIYDALGSIEELLSH
ncbi:hypothetical protein ACVIHI_008580 [Bradyrhizobium sp. USDA 4524]|nr:hypothetical protein [Bradyrhizobium sp. USDA 4538]MCP1907408.1 hypothetical protein [Bradyrhizobium sp. USDA 4537]MCP1985194.1 hypothetical protein [Bradyrhizobium sp. USDA 4539]